MLLTFRLITLLSLAISIIYLTYKLTTYDMYYPDTCVLYPQGYVSILTNNNQNLCDNCTRIISIHKLLPDVNKPFNLMPCYVGKLTHSILLPSEYEQLNIHYIFLVLVYIFLIVICILIYKLR